jgi:hypothetical protein
MKFYRYPTKRQHTKRNRPKYVVNIHIDGEHAIRVIRQTEYTVDKMADSIIAYLKLLNRKAEIDENRRNKE